ncbi:MAG TPA: hypothetical protein VN193_13860 [Candidatus Angelobacter sp.]|jgi:hypothetical protein|nr:hypothetical protein [Candidatus Angelobacter sp.]
MARNSENAPSEPSARRRKPPEEGGSHLRQHFRESIRDALTGVDVDALQGRTSLPVPSDVSLLTREVVSDLELELAKLRAERAELEKGGTAEAVASAPAPAPAAAPRWRARRRGRVEADAAGGVGNGVASRVAWSVGRAMEPVGEGSRESAPDGDAGPAANGAPAPGDIAAAAEIAAGPAAETAAPGAVTAPASTSQSAPKSSSALSDTELESVVAPLLAELANLRAEVRDLRGDASADVPANRAISQSQLVRLVAGVLIGFALIVIALAVVLKA